MLGVLVFFSTIRLFFPPFNDDLGTMPTRRPYSWKKKGAMADGDGASKQSRRGAEIQILSAVHVTVAVLPLVLYDCESV